MTDLTPVPPAPDGLAEAFRAARQRRLRSLGATSGISAGLVLGLLLLLGPGGQMTLVQQPSPVVPAVEGSPDPERQVATRGHLPRPGPRAGAVNPGKAPDSSRPTAAAHAPSQAAASGVSRYRSALITRDDTGVPVPDPRCAVAADGTTHNPQICPSVIARKAGQGFDLYADLCSTSTEPLSLHYTSTHEVDFVVYRGQRAVWRWSHGHTARPWVHALSLDSGHCRGWGNAWTAVDDQGELLPRGDYRLVAEYAAAETRDRPTWETTFSIS